MHNVPEREQKSRIFGGALAKPGLRQARRKRTSQKEEIKGFLMDVVAASCDA